jgi:hypothetical protein
LALLAVKFQTAQRALSMTDSKYQKTYSRIVFLLAFCNAYNTKAFETGQGQIILSTRLQDDGYLDLMQRQQLMLTTYTYILKNYLEIKRLVKR